MREQYYIQGIQGAHDRITKLEDRLRSIYKVLEEIIGKELLRGQALHKVLMEKNLFTDAELKTALEALIAESQAEMKKMEAKAAEEKAKAIELLVPAGANLTSPVDAPPLPVVNNPTEGTNASPTEPTQSV
jgi:hypothetical protein